MAYVDDSFFFIMELVTLYEEEFLIFITSKVVYMLYKGPEGKTTQIFSNCIFWCFGPFS